MNNRPITVSNRYETVQSCDSRATRVNYPSRAIPYPTNVLALSMQPCTHILPSEYPETRARLGLREIPSKQRISIKRQLPHFSPSSFLHSRTSSSIGELPSLFNGEFDLTQSPEPSAATRWNVRIETKIPNSPDISEYVAAGLQTVATKASSFHARSISTILIFFARPAYRLFEISIAEKFARFFTRRLAPSGETGSHAKLISRLRAVQGSAVCIRPSFQGPLKFDEADGVASFTLPCPASSSHFSPRHRRHISVFYSRAILIRGRAVHPPGHYLVTMCRFLRVRRSNCYYASYTFAWIDRFLS